MTRSFRTATGGRIERARALRFQFDGREYSGFAGDTLASALLANGVHLVGRSFKYHRPRGILSAGPEEPNALVAIRRDAARITPNLRATEVELYDGLEAYSQNRWPSLALDTGAVSGLLAPLIPAGFYYKTFMWPRGAWHRLYEPRIRAAAGLGRAPDRPDPDTYCNRFAHCDVLVVGSGPAGLAAARAAASSGARVILCDEQPQLGGSLLSLPPDDRCARIESEHVVEVIDAFLADSPGLVAILRASLDAGDTSELRRAAHTLKSNGATLGAQRFSDLCRELEQRAKKGDLADAVELVGRIQEAYDELDGALTARVEQTA